MGTYDPRVDRYIEKAAEFARPILRYLREVVHEGCPDVEEGLKWGTPHFSYKGMMCGMAAFKSHCAFGFWKAALIEDKPGVPAKVDLGAMGQFGRLTSLKELPAKRTLLSYVKQAAALNEKGVKAPMRKKPRPPAKLVVPDDLKRALAKNKKAGATFDAFSPTNKREYIEWLEEAKTDATRLRRLDQAIEWMAQGKDRNWKYR